MNPISGFFCQYAGLVLCLTLMTSPVAHGASLFGDYSCQRWRGTEAAEKRTWTNAFLSPLSLTMKGLHKNKEDKYNDDPHAFLSAIRYIDAFCMSHPDLGASDAAGRYLKKLLETSSNTHP
jgi:hypothetical protein